MGDVIQFPTKPSNAKSGRRANRQSSKAPEGFDLGFAVYDVPGDPDSVQLAITVPRARWGEVLKAVQPALTA